VGVTLWYIPVFCYLLQRSVCGYLHLHSLPPHTTRAHTHTHTQDLDISFIVELLGADAEVPDAEAAAHYFTDLCDVNEAEGAVIGEQCIFPNESTMPGMREVRVGGQELSSFGPKYVCGACGEQQPSCRR